jgi:hypothetical protein
MRFRLACTVPRQTDETNDCNARRILRLCKPQTGIFHLEKYYLLWHLPTTTAPMAANDPCHTTPLSLLALGELPASLRARWPSHIRLKVLIHITIIIRTSGWDNSAYSRREAHLQVTMNPSPIPPHITYEARAGRMVVICFNDGRSVQCISCMLVTTLKKDDNMKRIVYYQVRILLLRDHHSNSFRIYRLTL